VPTLAAISGPVQGRTFALPDGEWTVGRSSRNQLWLDDPEVSRRHCAFFTDGDSCEVRDLGSRNLVFVNGQPTPAVALAAGDEIVIGSSTFVFSVESPSTAEKLEGGTRVTQLRPDQAAYVSGNAAAPLSDRSARDLKTLLRLANLLHSVRTLHDAHGGSPRDMILERLGNMLLDLIPAERAAVLTPESDNELGRRAREERVALWARDEEGGGATRLAAPLLVREAVPAVLYMESSAARRPLGEDDLQMLTAIAEIAAVAWENASILSWLQEQNRQLEDTLGFEHELLGQGAPLQELQRRMAKAAVSAASVLIVGESGTGKELVARALHRNSPRASGPFFAINCAALTDTLLESELFGHEKGAFTGATETRRGKLEAAEGGTLFFDEVGELALPLQAKLLRVIETREMQRVGGTQTIRLNIRFVAATNRDLEEFVRKGLFRQDLYFRLKVITLRTPPLRDHAQDIPVLADHFARKAARACGRRIVGIAAETMSCLRSYAWPGNVRELANAMESAVVLGSSETIALEDLPDHILASAPAEAAAGSYAAAVESAKRDAILRAFEQSGYNHDAAARALGIHPNYLHKLLRTMNMKVTVKKRGR
jgi:DNA-binding NtrC family response regulator/pSer/pThr/pTyr-binding forkhead associated (FHA) protein